MARAHCAVVAYDPTTNTVLTSATVNVYAPGTVTAITATMFDRNGNVLSNPLTSDATTGLVDFYLNVAQEVDLVVSKTGFTTRTYSNVPVLDDASNNLTALLTTTGDIPYASSANTPARLAIGGTGALLNVAAGIPTWLAIGIANQIMMVSSGVPTWTSLYTALNGLAYASNSLGADVNLNNTANYFDGPSVAQGATGIWFVTGQVTLDESANTASLFDVKLWDGTTVIDSAAVVNVSGIGNPAVVHLSGVISAPAGNLRISARDQSATTGRIRFNASGNSRDSTITAFRIG